MKRAIVSLVAAVVVLVVLKSPLSNAAGEEDAEKQIVSLEKKWTDLSQRKDVKAVEPLLADDYAFIGTEGDIGDKTLLLKHMREGEPDEPTYKVWKIDELRARVYGKTAVATGRWVGSDTGKDPNASLAERWTDVWVNEGGNWKCVASHSTTILKK
jgi:ketosteroid isomerase-like protein